MKKLILIFTIVFLAIAANAQNTYVLIVGVSNYGGSNNLVQTTKDAKAFKKLINTQTKNVTLLTSKYANKANVMEKLRAISNRAQSDDKIIFYYAGHGYPGGMCMYDGNLDYQTFNDILAKSDAKAKICFVDACHAGSVNDVKDPTYKAPASGNIVYLQACRADEYSTESAWVGHGLFTQALLKGMRGKADANGDKKVTVDELYKYIYQDVQHSTAKMEASQHPTMIGSKAASTEVVMQY